MKKMKVTLELIEEMLGTANADPKIYEEFIASKALDAKSREEEVAAIGVEAAVEKSMTILPKDKDGNPFVWDYQIRGFFKAACAALQRSKDKDLAKESMKLKAYKKAIDGNIFVKPRRIPIKMPEGGKIGDCQRPLRAKTPQGTRVALANSETVPAGSRIAFYVWCLGDSYEKVVKEWLNYGQFNGLGQWRNSGKGAFEVVSVEDVE